MKIEVNKSRAKRWLGVINNYTKDEYVQIQCVIREDCTYGIIGKEVGKNGTPHIHFYMEFKDRKRFLQVRKLMPKRDGKFCAHLQVARGTSLQNLVYITKEDKKAWSHGVASNPKFQDKSLEIMVKENFKMEDIMDCHFNSFIRYHAGIRKARDLQRVTRNWTPILVFICGDTGTGKSNFAFSIDPDQQSYSNTFVTSLVGNFPFNNYDGEKIIINDEMGKGKNLPYRETLRMMDSKPMNVEVKGGHVKLGAYIYVFAGIEPPYLLYPKEKSKKEFYRRINDWGFVYKCSRDGKKFVLERLNVPLCLTTGLPDVNYSKNNPKVWEKIDREKEILRIRAASPFAKELNLTPKPWKEEDANINAAVENILDDDVESTKTENFVNDDIITILKSIPEIDLDKDDEEEECEEEGEEDDLETDEELDLDNVQLLRIMDDNDTSDNQTFAHRLPVEDSDLEFEDDEHSDDENIIPNDDEDDGYESEEL